MKRFFTLIIFAALFMAAAWAETHWTLFSEGVRGTKLYLDYQTIRRETRDGVMVWTKYDKSAGDYWIEHEQFYRPTKQDRVLSWYHYAANGELIDGSSTPLPWIDVIPESLSEGLFDTLFPRQTTY